MKLQQHPPDPSALLASLRAIGYSFSTSLADIIDNSISAMAKHVHIVFRGDPGPYVAILDDGLGMSADGLLVAMRHGGFGPNRERREDDLGRFGLGLKTASLSQCKQLTVATLRNGELSAACWDIDVVEQCGGWALQILEEDDVASLPEIDALLGQESGTLVVWRKFDGAAAASEKPGEIVGGLVDEARDHLALVFHRFVAPRPHERGCKIAINGNELESLDPFLTSNPATQELPTERIKMQEDVVEIRPFILPRPSKLAQSDLRRAGSREALRQTQGFYVYRNRRLITYGTWFRLIRQDELTKLARVSIDIPNTLDHLWGIDVKKATASPPEPVRQVLRRIINRIADSGASVFRERRRRIGQQDVTYVWERHRIRDGVIYTINRDHPMIATLRQTLSSESVAWLDRVLKTIELALPVTSIYADMARDGPLQQSTDETKLTLLSLAKAMIERVAPDRALQEALRDALPSLEPFSKYPSITKGIIEELRSE